jgi:serine/threonine protein kinase
MMKGTAGSLKYIAPENILGNGCYFLGDVYSFGVLLWELLSSLDIPFGNMSSHEYQVEVAVEGYRPNVPRVGAAVPKSVKVLIQDCSDEDRSVRPTFSQVRKKKNRPPGQQQQQQQQQRRGPLSMFRLSGFRTTTTTSDP